MILLEQPAVFENSYDLTRLGQPDQLLFFDIETTGFSGDSSQLYLIGCLYYEGGQWLLRQYFADTQDSEPQILDSFFSFLSRFRTLIHFNGDGFDLPYLQKRCACLNRPWDFSQVRSVDIYRRIRPFRKLLGLSSLKQKAIEAFLGVSREDRYSGGELIQVYHRYLASRDRQLMDLLLLHNADDLRGMPSILPILNYPDLLEGDLTLLNQQLIRGSGQGDSPVPSLCLEAESPVQVPVPIQEEDDLAAVSIEGSQIRCRVQMYQGELKYFYPDYKNYYYLPYEDMAVHKSVGEYVDKEARTRATAKNCYTRRQGLFLPQFEELWKPSLRRDYKDKISYAEYSPRLLEEPGAAQTYIRQVISHI